MLMYHPEENDMKLGCEYNKVLHIRLSEEQYRKIKESAKLEKLSVSAFVRNILSSYED